MLGTGHSTEIPLIFRTANTHNAAASSHDHEGPQTITLKILSANESHPIRTLVLPANIGRIADQRVRPSGRNGLFSSPFLSRHHAIIKLEKQRVVIEDLGSCNGTFVNGIAVKSGESWPIADGDLLQFGSEDDDANNAAIVAQVFYQESTIRKHEVNRGDLMIIDDPFSETNVPDTSSLSDLVGAKIADITRALASLGVMLRTHQTLKTKHSSKGTLQILESIEGLIQQLSRETTFTDNNEILLENFSPTIHQQPNLPDAMNIIVLIPSMPVSLDF